MIVYKFSFRRGLFWKDAKVIGHRYEEKQDKMVLYYLDGGIEEISMWSACDARLGPDWVAAMKHDMEQKAGQTVPINRSA